MTQEKNKIQTKLLSTAEVCSCLGIGRNTMYKLLQSGSIPAFRIGTHWKIPESSITEFIREQICSGKENTYVR